MIRPDEILKGVRVASPCPTSWDNMEGDERVRFCSLCSLNVYNLSEMTAKEAASLVTQHEGRRLCICYFQRADGTMLTQDCPVGVRAIRKRLANALACVFVLFIGSLAFASNLARKDPDSWDSSSLLANARDRIGHVEPFRTVLDWIDPRQPAAVLGSPTPGVMAYIPPTPPVGPNTPVQGPHRPARP